MEADKLSITMQVVKQGGELYAQLRFANRGAEPFPLERALSGQEIPAGRQLFRLLNESGEEIPYIGLTGKVEPPEYPDDYLDLQPGAELLAVYPFGKEYGFASGGQDYRMQYDVVNALPGDKGLAFLKSNVASFSYP